MYYKDIPKDLIDLRHENKKMIEEYGHDVLVQKTNKKFRCKCWVESYREAKSNCPYCLGSGYVYRIEKHRVRRDNASQIISRPKLLQSTEIGKIHLPARIFWMSYDSEPKEGDIIFEVGWKNGKPTHVISAYEINDVEDKRADDGRLEYYYVACDEKKGIKNISKIVIKQWGMTTNYEFMYDV
ncbi:MAG: hypothetical protein N2043_02245 [Ignavibacterium sp.]|nr:hypothetical protein [Ignavibacterium sp.]